MKPFLTTKRKLFELALMLVIDLILYLIWQSWDMLVLFSFGFVWNWVASQDLTDLTSSGKYRLSMVKTVQNLQIMVLSPVDKAPQIVKFLVKILPAGIFWSLIIFFNSSEMPWWMTFVGSLAYEIIQLEILNFKKEKDKSFEIDTGSP